MNIEGTYTLQAQPGEVWRCLLDPQVLQQTVPGARRIEQVDEDTCSVIVNVKQGTYQGQMTLSEQEYPYQCHVTVNGEGRQVAFDGSGDITLSEQNGATVIAYRGSLALQKTSALLRPTLVKGAAKLLIQQFFTGLADQLRARQVQVVEAQAGEQGKERVAGDIVLLSPGSAAPAFSMQSIFQKVVHRMQLGAGDPMREARWARRLQRISFIAGLVFLVWVGTRLPRRR